MAQALTSAHLAGASEVASGEFHTFVHAGPVFARPIEIEVGPVVMREGSACCDLRPAASAAI